MRTILASCFVFFFAVGVSPAQRPGSGAREAGIVDSAVATLEEIAAIPEKSIPPRLLLDAQAVAILPGIVKAGFVVGGRHGRGLVTVRTATGGWSNPVFLHLTGGSIGWQAGIQSTDLVLIFRTKRSADRLLQGRDKFTLGASASVAAGPIGRQASAETDLKLSAEILSYSRSRGLFAGISVEGAVLKVHDQADSAFYGRSVTPDEIVAGANMAVPVEAVKLSEILNRLAPAPVVVIPTPARK